MRRIVAYLTLAILLMGSIIYVPVAAEENRFVTDVLEENIPFEIPARSAVLMEAQTGCLILEKNSHERLPIASVTKIMSLILFMEALDEGKINLDDIVAVSEHASSMGGSQIWLEVGEEMTVHDLLRAVAVRSANDAATALSEKVAGSEEAFVTLMNQKAKDLGLKDTNFLDCTGLTDEGHYSSAHDIALMSRELLNNHPNITQYTTIWHEYLRDGETEIHNTNALIHPKTGYKGCTGLKTGFTNASMYCLSATATRENMTLIAVALGSDTPVIRNALCVRLLDHGFANYELATIEKKGEVISNIPIKKGMKVEVPVVYESNADYLLKKGERDKVKEQIQIMESIDAPVEKGKIVGKAIYSIDNRKLGEIQLVASQDVGMASWFKLFFKMFVLWFGLNRF